VVPINAAPFVPDGDDNTAPIHHDDECCNGQNCERENEPGDGHPDLPMGWLSLGTGLTFLINVQEKR